jgi:hypothetical protein
MRSEPHGTWDALKPARLFAEAAGDGNGSRLGSKHVRRSARFHGGERTLHEGAVQQSAARVRAVDGRAAICSESSWATVLRDWFAVREFVGRACCSRRP